MGTLDVVVLGCGDAFGSGGRNQTGILVSLRPWSFVFDCGATTLVAMKRYNIHPGELELILVSHLHGDHMAGVPFLFLEYQFQTPRERPLLIAGPPGIQVAIEGLFKLIYSDVAGMERTFSVEYVELAEGQWQRLGSVDVLPVRVRHLPHSPSYGYKVVGAGRTLAYSGDTAWTEALVELAEGADLFICECHQYDGQVPVHLSYADLSANLSRLNCKRLLLTHLGEEMLTKLDRIPLEAARDGMRLEV